MLPINIVRINGYKDNKRTHVDIVVKLMEIVINGEKKVIIPCRPHFSDIATLGFNKGLDGVTSYNYYNWVGNERITERV